MKAIYNAYVWKCVGCEWKLEWSVKDIVACSKQQAEKRSMSALRSRPGLQGNSELRQLKQHLYGYGECPSGIVLQVAKVIDGPPAQPCVI